MVAQRSLILALILMFISTPVSVARASEYEQRVFSPDPAVMGQGGAAVATATGYTALFANPAGFAQPSGEFTVLSGRSWVHARSSEALTVTRLLVRDRTVPEDSDTYRRLERAFRRNGLGAGTSLGIAYVGRGLGIGLHTTADGFLYGQSFDDGSGTLSTETSLVGGLAFPFEIGPVRVQLGAAARPLIRVHSIIDADDEDTAAGSRALVQHFLGLETGYDGDDYAAELRETYYGYGVGVDAGLQLFWNDWTVGAAVRDIGDTALNYSRTDMRTVLEELKRGALPPEAEEDEEGYVERGVRKLPMHGTVGIAYAPDTGDWAGRIDPRFQVELDDVFQRVHPGLPPESRINLGVELLFFRSVALRGGVHQGYLTAGAGIDLPGIEINAAVFSRELGSGFREERSSTAALEFAIRF